MSADIIKLVTGVIESQGFEVILVKSESGYRVRAWIDSEPDGVTVQDCATLTRAVNEAFEQEGLDPGDYQIEVQSPGVDRLLVRDKDFIRFVGEKVHVTLKEKRLARKNFKGELVGLVEGEIVVRGDEEWRFTREEIDTVRLVPQIPNPPEKKNPNRKRKPRKSRRKRPKDH